jgi:hypothetical protein
LCALRDVEAGEQDCGAHRRGRRRPYPESRERPVRR